MEIAANSICWAHENFSWQNSKFNMKSEIERMEINYTLYFFAFFEKVIKKTIDILLLVKRLFLAELHLPQSGSKKEFCWKPQANGPTWSGLIFFTVLPQLTHVPGPALLYSASAFFLDRGLLSIKNGWIDNQGRVFIYYSIKNICEDLNCGTQKVCKLLDELEKVGALERKRQGLGRPNKLYLKKMFWEIAIP